MRYSSDSNNGSEMGHEKWFTIGMWMQTHNQAAEVKVNTQRHEQKKQQNEEMSLENEPSLSRCSDCRTEECNKRESSIVYGNASPLVCTVHTWAKLQAKSGIERIESIQRNAN
ncbi:hypothetical protein WR25_08374 [Diploscapter pachys]|uniref:Uncharacterized protein n=1 Tax=Diploscapter pachys TaxID=2018661 RepID=A0A2A2L2D3_9BILA|nr:hypothetical protein WR25_08374 [Diploscapter pachys]